MEHGLDRASHAVDHVHEIALHNGHPEGERSGLS